MPLPDDPASRPDVAAALERAYLDLLDARAADATVCPSEAARRVDPQGWRALMEPARAAAQRLVDDGVVVVTQRGVVVDLASARGPVRVRRAGGAGTLDE